MSFKKSLGSIFHKERREINHIKKVYKKRVQAEIDSYKVPDYQDKRDTIQAHDILMFDKFSFK